jgi:general secretion pathway protein A
VRGVYINSPTLTRAEFVEMIALRFGLSSHAAESKTAMLAELEPLLLERRSGGEIVALVVDEAQSLSGELLEEIRLLANLESYSEKLLPVVLAGQSELHDRLNEASLHQLKQRVTLRCELKPFALEETAKYIATRVRVAGGDPARIFTREAVVLIHQRSGGIPRTINVICDNALITGFGFGRQLINSEIVAGVVRDFDLERVASQPAEIKMTNKPTLARAARPPHSGETLPETPVNDGHGARMGSGPLFSLFRR